MKTQILPIKNMCGYVVGKAQVTTNGLGKILIQPLGNKNGFKGSGLIKKLGYVHFGLTDINKSQHA